MDPAELLGGDWLLPGEHRPESVDSDAVGSASNSEPGVRRVQIAGPDGPRTIEVVEDGSGRPPRMGDGRVERTEYTWDASQGAMPPELEAKLREAGIDPALLLNGGKAQVRVERQTTLRGGGLDDPGFRDKLESLRARGRNRRDAAAAAAAREASAGRDPFSRASSTAGRSAGGRVLMELLTSPMVWIGAGTLGLAIAIVVLVLVAVG